MNVSARFQRQNNKRAPVSSSFLPPLATGDRLQLPSRQRSPSCTAIYRIECYVNCTPAYLFHIVLNTKPSRRYGGKRIKRRRSLKRACAKTICRFSLPSTALLQRNPIGVSRVFGRSVKKNRAAVDIIRRLAR